MILDPRADQQQVKKTLEKLNNQLEQLHGTAFQYKAYQKNFKVEVTKYEELEEVYAELKMKQQLWGSIDEWDELVNGWMNVSTPQLLVCTLVVVVGVVVAVAVAVAAAAAAVAAAAAAVVVVVAVVVVAAAAAAVVVVLLCEQ